MTRIEVTGTWRFYRTGAMIVSRPRRVHEVGTLERPPPFSPLGMTGAPPFQRSVAFAPGTASSAPAPPGAAALAVATRWRRASCGTVPLRASCCEEDLRVPLLPSLERNRIIHVLDVVCALVRPAGTAATAAALWSTRLSACAEDGWQCGDSVSPRARVQERRHVVALHGDCAEAVEGHCCTHKEAAPT